MYENISATTEMLHALEQAAERGLVRTDDPTDSLSFWRDADSVLYATEKARVEPCATRVEIEFERGAGYRAI